MITPKLRAIIEHDIPGYILYERDQKVFTDLIKSFKDGTHVFVTIKKIVKRKERSAEQNKYYWWVLRNIFMESFGYDPEEMHEALKGKFLKYENVPGLPTVLSTKKLSTVEFEIYLEKIRRWAATDWGIYVPKPNEVDYEG